MVYYQLVKDLGEFMNKKITALLLASAIFFTPVVSSAENSEENFANNAKNIEQNIEKSEYTAEQFINILGKEARRIGQENNIYASVMIAQACLESGFGKSGLSQNPNNNLFGIKGEYNGNSSDFQTWEDYGGRVDIVDSFRIYPSFKESMEDYADLLLKGSDFDENYYSGAWKSNASTYQEATAALTGRYATDSQYANKLNKLIEDYNLASFDYPVSYTVKEKNKENLLTISEKTGISLEELKEFNPEIKDENKFLRKDKTIILRSEYYKENFKSPVSTEFKVLNDFNTSITENKFKGLDLEVPYNTYVYSINRGEVVEVSEDNSNGKYIVIQHENGLLSHYSNLDNVYINVGDKVTDTDIIGNIKGDKESNKAILSFSIAASIGSNFVNPKLFLDI